MVFLATFAGAAVVFVAIVRVALARALTVAFRRTPPTVSWGQPSTDSGRRTGFLPLTKYLPITIHMLKTRETDKPAVAPLVLAQGAHRPTKKSPHRGPRMAALMRDRT